MLIDIDHYKDSSITYSDGTKIEIPFPLVLELENMLKYIWKSNKYLISRYAYIAMPVADESAMQLPLDTSPIELKTVVFDVHTIFRIILEIRYNYINKYHKEPNCVMLSTDDIKCALTEGKLPDYDLKISGDWGNISKVIYSPDCQKSFGLEI